MPGLFAMGWSVRICLAYWTLKRRKSISSQALSVSAWKAVFDWPSIVAALIRWRHGPASRSAALSRIAQRSSKAIPRHSGAASVAACTASLASVVVEFRSTPRTCWWSCGWTTRISSPPAARQVPPMWARRSCWVPWRFSISATRASRSGLPGAYVRFGSLVGAGGKEIASMLAMLSPPAGRPQTSLVGSEQVLDLLGGEPREVVVLVRVVVGVDVGGGDVLPDHVRGDVDQRGVLPGHRRHRRHVGGHDVAARDIAGPPQARRVGGG